MGSIGNRPISSKGQASNANEGGISVRHGWSNLVPKPNGHGLHRAWRMKDWTWIQQHGFGAAKTNASNMYLMIGAIVLPCSRRQGAVGRKVSFGCCAPAATQVLAELPHCKRVSVILTSLASLHHRAKGRRHPPIRILHPPSSPESSSRASTLQGSYSLLFPWPRTARRSTPTIHPGPLRVFGALGVCERGVCIFVALALGGDGDLALR